jgi:sugar (pentulose or hexulose) kinase
VILGTTLSSFVILEEKAARQQKVSVGSLLCHAGKGLYIRQMPALSGASSLDWVRKEIAHDEDYDSLERGMSGLPAGSGGLLFLPYLYGERAPFRKPGASGAFIGLRGGHTRYHLVRAAYEGVAMSVRDCLSHLPQASGEIFVAGGISRSNFFCQLLSDCLGAVIRRSPEKELGIKGIYRLMRGESAAPAGAQTDTPADAQRAGFPGRDKFQPDMAGKVLFDELYSRFLATRNAVEPLW